mmetsp:Transcript_67161/g.160842  ORF Transcript_67161/g.160842 Transcript_67161/m.160842 type:complete len:993 (+) Transcript_67161:72-3050(+)
MSGEPDGKKLVSIIKPDTHKRTYAGFQLDNGIKVVIGTDPECDMAGASLCVNVGMCHERKDLPGLAHFLEHMLFTGTKTFPEEKDYHEYMQQNGGYANAYTACYFTNYMFEVKPEALAGGLDRFSRFFYEALLTKDATDREINAVDSEFQGGSTDAWWRSLGILHMCANPEHPFHVAVGNNKCLRDDPKERGVDLYEEMVKLYDSCYSANGMTLCVIAKESIEELEAMIREKFAPVVNKGVTMPIGDSVSDKPPFIGWNQLLLQTPVKDIKELTFSWVIPFQKPLWRSKPADYIQHLLGHEGSGSVIAKLKEQGLIAGGQAGDGAWLEGAFSFFNMRFELTDAGVSEVCEIGRHVFTYLAMLQKSVPEKWIFDEMVGLRRIQFQFREDSTPFQLAPDIAEALMHYPIEEALSGDSLIYDFNPDGIQAILKKLTLDQVRVQYQAKSLADQCTDKDTSYDSPMKLLPIKEEWLKVWQAAMNPGDGSTEAAMKAAEALELHLPERNPFIPEDLSLKPLPAEPVKMFYPLRLVGSPPVAAIFYRQDDTFKQPKVVASFNIYSPFICKDAVGRCKAELWCQAVEEALQEYAYDASVAGMHYKLSASPSSIGLMAVGFNDKMGTLLAAVLEKIRTFAEVPENIFQIVYDSYSDAISNETFHAKAYQQINQRFGEISSSTACPPYKRYEALKTLKREDLSNLAEQLFKECHAEGIVVGNASQEDALRYGQILADGLKCEKPLAKLPDAAESQFPEGSTLWRWDSVDPEDPNHAVCMRIQLPSSLESDLWMSLVDMVLSAKFFEDLRTQQQLGYIVQMNFSSSSAWCYLNFTVQGEFPPDYARSRIDKFVDEHLQKYLLETLSEEEFERCRQGLLANFKVMPKSIFEEFHFMRKALNERTWEFARRIKATKFLETSVSLDGLRTFVKEKLASAPRLYQQVKKTMQKEDKPLPAGNEIPPIDPSWRCWDGHKETVAAFVKEATWKPLNRDAQVPAAASPPA